MADGVAGIRICRRVESTIWRYRAVLRASSDSLNAGEKASEEGNKCLSMNNIKY
jgi:hypothetical protein